MGTWEVIRQGQKIRLIIHGTVDGKFSFPEPEELQSVQEIEMDLKQLTSMNSEGIRNWIQWHRGLNPAIHFSYYEASRVFITLASIVSGLVPDALCIKSFYVSYSSEDGRKNASQLVEQSSNGQFRIPKKYQGLELDHHPAKDFRVLNGHYTLV